MAGGRAPAWREQVTPCRQGGPGAGLRDVWPQQLAGQQGGSWDLWHLCCDLKSVPLAA